MLAGILVLAAIFGAFAAMFSLMSGGSALVALGIYSLSGVLAVLVLALFSVVRKFRVDPSENRMAATPAE